MVYAEVRCGIAYTSSRSAAVNPIWFLDLEWPAAQRSDIHATLSDLALTSFDLETNELTHIPFHTTHQSALNIINLL